MKHLGDIRGDEGKDRRMKTRRHERKPLSTDELERHKTVLSEDQFRVLRGLILHGDAVGAMAGLNKILRRNGRTNRIERSAT